MTRPASLPLAGCACPAAGTLTSMKGHLMPITARLEAGDFAGPFSEWRRFAEQRLERAALLATDRAARELLTRLRGEMAGAGLGRLGNALAATSDLKRGKGVHRLPGGGFSASGLLYVRSRSERTIGALEAYTSGATIAPVRGRWLWIASDSIPRVSKRQRMTPAMWNANGFDRKIGPLVFVKSASGMPLLIVRNVGVSTAGAKGSARSLTKRGAPRRGQVQQDFVVAFFAIPRTSRAARVDVAALGRSIAADLPAIIEQALGRI